jgi:hypothetical protein
MITTRHTIQKAGFFMCGTLFPRGAEPTNQIPLKANNRVWIRTATSRKKERLYT